MAVSKPPTSAGQKQTHRQYQDHRRPPKHLPRAAQKIQQPHSFQRLIAEAAFCANLQ